MRATYTLAQLMRRIFGTSEDILSRPMTAEMFFNRLEAVKDEYDFEIGPDGDIRTAGEGLSPIAILMRKRVQNNHAVWARHDLGLQPALYNEIMIAANRKPWMDPLMRKRLLKVLELQERVNVD